MLCQKSKQPNAVTGDPKITTLISAVLTDCCQVGTCAKCWKSPSASYGDSFRPASSRPGPAGRKRLALEVFDGSSLFEREWERLRQWIDRAKWPLTGYRQYDIILRMVDLDEQLREAIRRSGMTRKQIADQAGVPYSIVHGFVSGERGMTLRVASRVAELLALELREVRRKSKGR